jgi:hypothetical protein
MKPRNTFPRVTYRFLSGRLLFEPFTTDATYGHQATQALTTHGRASSWARMSGYKRQLYRHGTLAALTASTYSYIHDPLMTEVALYNTGLAVGGLTTVKAVRHMQMRKHMREWVIPLRKAVAALMYPNGDMPKDAVYVPLDVHDEGEVRIVTPGYVSEATRKELVSIVGMKLGMTTDTTDVWHFKGRDNYLTMRRLPLPPDKVTLETARDVMLSAKEAEPVLGLGRRGKPITFNLDAESAHALIALPTGRGKSVVSRAICAQLMRHGASVICLDLKRQSHRWMRNLPGVTYCRDISEIHDELVALAEECDRRNRLTDDIPDDVDTTELDIGNRIVLLAEELNATMSRLQTYWGEIKEKGDPNVSPAIAAFRTLLFVGRAVKIHIVAITQSGTTKSLGGPEARENFIVRIVGGSANQWKMLAPHVNPIPRPSRKPGRMHVVIGEDVHLMQALYLTDAEAKEWATAGPVTVPSQWSNATVMTGRKEKVYGLTLSEVAAREVVPVKYSTLRTHKHRDSSFPEPIGKRGESDIYDPSQLVNWWEQRNATKATTKADS